MAVSVTVTSMITIMMTLSVPVSNDVIESNKLDLDHFDHVLMTYMRERHIPGASIAISSNGHFLVRKGYGKASPHQMVSPWSLFRIGSVSKAVTAMGILRLYEETRLDLDDHVFGPFGVLKQFTPGPEGDQRLRDVTIYHLLRHQGGWDHSVTGDPLMRRDLNRLLNQSGLPDKETIISYMMSQPLQNEPGSTFSYSNFGYLVLGRVLEHVSGVSYNTYIRGLLRSVGIYRMKLGNTSKNLADKFEVEYYSEFPGDRVQSIFPEEGLVPPPYGGFCLENMDSTSGWVGSAPELVKFYEALNGTGIDGRRLLKPDTFQLMVSPSDDKVHQAERMWYGMGVVVQDQGRTYWHSGHLEGSTALASRDESGIAWSILANYKVRNTDLADVMRYAIYRFQQVNVMPNNSNQNVFQKTRISGQVHAISRDGNNLVQLLIPEYKIKNTISTLSNKGYRLKWIDVTEHYGVLYFNTIWTKSDRSKWKAYIDLSPSRYTRRFKAKVAQGYRLSFLETYTQGRRLRYAAVFVRDGWPPWVTYHGYSPHKHQQMFYHYLKAGYQLSVQSVIEFKGQVYVAAIYEKIILGDTRVRMGLTGSDLSEELNTQIKQGRILSYIQAYTRMGIVKFSAIWIPQTTFEWAVSKSMTKYTLLYKLQQYADINVPLTCVTSYMEDDTFKFAALWL